MDAIKAKVVFEGTKTNGYQIFCEVVGEPNHDRILGMGIGIKAKDVYGLTSFGKGCSKHCREDFTKEKEDLEAHLREEMDSKLAKVVEKLEEKFAQKLQSMGIPQQSNIDPATTVHSQTYVLPLGSSTTFYWFVVVYSLHLLLYYIILYLVLINDNRTMTLSTVLTTVYRFCI